jgi:hypothetical protein
VAALDQIVAERKTAAVVDLIDKKNEAQPSNVDAFRPAPENTGIPVCGFDSAKRIFEKGDDRMKKQIRIFHEKISDIGVSLEAIVGLLLSAGVIAIVLRLASGKW